MAFSKGFGLKQCQAPLSCISIYISESRNGDSIPNFRNCVKNIIVLRMLSKTLRNITFCCLTFKFFLDKFLFFQNVSICRQNNFLLELNFITSKVGDTQWTFQRAQINTIVEIISSKIRKVLFFTKHVRLVEIS